MSKSTKRSGRSIRPERSPVIAIRVPAPLHEEVSKAAKAAGRTISEHMAEIVARGQEWQGLINEARNVLQQANAEAKRIVRGTLETELRRRNWKREADTGKWVPPEVHGYPPDGFIADPDQLDPRIAVEIKRAVNAALDERDAR
jgi:hypothetical protein